MFEASKYFWGHQPVWPLSQIPDPHNPDPMRYVFLAAVMDLLLMSYGKCLDLCQIRGYNDVVAAYNTQPGECKRLELQPHETLPGWVTLVPLLPEPLVLCREDGLPRCVVT